VSAQKPTTTTRPLEIRRPRFDWSGAPRHWLGGRPGLTHFFNALHLLFPPAERWFVKTALRALPEINDALAAAVRGFVGQEGSHAGAHQAYLAVLETQGFRVEPLRRRVEALFDQAGQGPEWLQRSIIAGAEQHTASLARWVFERPVLDGADPMMRDLLLWHAAEEIEHKSVAFDILAATHPGHAMRLLGGLIATIELTRLWLVLAWSLIGQDPLTTKRTALRDLGRAFFEGRLPFGVIFRSALRYAWPGFHPEQEDHGDHAASYLAESPAVAAARTGRAR